MKNIKSSQNMIAMIVIALSVGACATSDKKLEYPVTANSAQEIASFEERLKQSEANQADVTGRKHFEEARESLADAKESMREGDKNEKTLARLSEAKRHLDKADATVAKGKGEIAEILDARNKAINAKARNFFPEDLAKLDRSLSGETKVLADGKSIDMDAEDRIEMQKDYLSLELKSVKKDVLGNADGMIQGAKKMGAKRASPKSLSEAEVKYKNAEAAIEASRNDPAGYKMAVDQAVESASQLIAVTETVKASKGKSPEEIALEIERRKTTISQQNQALSESNQKLTAEAAMNANQAQKLDASQRENRALSAKDRFNKTLEDAAKTFSKSEAEVYRQGDNLLIRLKSVQFPTGRTELPSGSLETLGKVRDVIGQLSADEILVEGHTDSTGKKANNEKLSVERAEAVAEYFRTSGDMPVEKIQAKGYGSEKPLTSNKTKEGRATNRRVDIVITPSGS